MQIFSTFKLSNDLLYGKAMQALQTVFEKENLGQFTPRDIVKFDPKNFHTGVHFVDRDGNKLYDSFVDVMFNMILRQAIHISQLRLPKMSIIYRNPITLS